MAGETIHIAIYAVLTLWIAYISWKLYLGFNLKSFMLITLSIVLTLVSISMSPVPHDILKVTSEVLFAVGVILMGTLELNKLKELSITMTLKDCLLGRIPSERVYIDVGLSRFEKLSLVFGSILLIIIPIIDYYLFDRGLRETWPLLLFGIVFVVYVLFANKKK